MRLTIPGFTKRIVPAFFTLLAAMALPAAAAAPSDPGEYVAYLDRAYPERIPLAEAARVRRHGEWQSVAKEHYGLKAGDELFITQPGTVVIVRILATSQRIPVGAAGTVAGGDPVPDWTVPAGPGLPGVVATWFRNFLEGSEHTPGRTQLAASRGAATGACFNEAGQTDEPNPFRVSALTAAGSVLVAGSRPVLVSWRGGAQPFSVALSQEGAKETVVEATGVRSVCAAYLPPVSLRPGHYRLTITDGNHAKIQKTLLVIADPPGLPAELREVNLPEEARQLYAATWLALLDDGKWGFEAQQRVAALDCRSAAVQDWLRQWGSPVPCGGAGH